MLNEKDIKPIPKYMLKLIQRRDRKTYPEQSGHTRYYAYITKHKKELVKVTVSCRNKGKNWYCK